MSFLKNLGQQTNDIKDEEDSLGGGARDSAVYDCTIKSAYLGVSQGGANSLTIVAKDKNSSHEFRETLWVTNKKGEPFYTYNNEKRFLPGYNVANAIAGLAAGVGLADLDTEEKTLQIYDFDEKKEMPTEVDCLVELHGCDIAFGIVKEVQDKTKKNDSTGVYEPTGETREVNVIDKVFHSEAGVTLAEAKTGVEEGVFIEKWKAKWDGQTRNKAKGAAGGSKAGAPAATGTPKKSLFKK